MSDNREYMSKQEGFGTIHISEEVLAAIACGAALEVEGVSSLMNGKGSGKSNAKGVRLTVQEEKIALDLYLMVKYGCAIPEVAERVQKAVAAAVEATTGFRVDASNVHVGGVTFE